MATNPYVNKVQYGNSTVMDITDTTASEGDVANGEVFYKKSGERATGTAMVAEIPLLPAHGGTGNTNGRVQVGQRSGDQIGQYATAEGYNNNASGQYAHAEGDSTVASSQGSHAEGSSTTASGTNAHAEGSSTTSSSTCTHAEGMGTTASNHYAHAEGANNTASGISSHAEGQNNTASGGYSHAGGFHTTAAYTNQTAIGTYNDNKSTTLFEVGNGSSNSASNAFEVYSDGHVNAQGEYYQGGVNKSAAWDAKVSESLLEDTVGWLGKNELPLTLDKLKSLNTHGTWSGNSFSNNSVTFACEFTSEGYLSKVTVSGTASSAANLFIDKSNGKQPYLGKRLTINGCPSGGSSSTYYINAYRVGTQDGSGGSFQETGNGYTFDYLNDASGTGGNISIGTASGYAASNLVFYPMLRDASITDDTYEPYHPSVKQTLRDAEVIEGKNLLSITAKTQTINDVTFTVNSDGSVKVNGTASAMALFVLNSNLEKVVNGGHYVLSGCPSGGGENSYRLEIRNSSDTIYTNAIDTGSGSGDIAPTSGFPAKATIRIASGYTANNVVFKPMLCTKEEWNKSHDYEPYYIPLKDAKFDRAEQRVLGAKNLLPMTLAGIKNLNSSRTWSGNSCTHNGVTFTVNTDSNGNVISISESGTATGFAFLRLARVSSFSGSYILNKGISADKFVYVQNESTSTLIASSTGGDVAVNLSPTSDVVNCIVAVNSGQTGTGIFYPMLRFASDPDDTFAPYVLTNKELMDSKDAWTAESIVSNGSVTFTGLDDTHGWGYEPYVWIDGNSTELDPYFKLTTISGAGTSNMTVIYSTNADSGSRVKLRIAK